MKKSIVVNSLLLSSAIVAIGATDSYAAQSGTVTASALNIRSGAGTNYSVITKAYKGDSVNILETKNGWYKVELSNGKTGWASADYISKGNSSSTGTATSGKGIVTASTLNIRSGAGTNYSVVTKAYKNDKVDLLETKSGWYKVKLSNGKTGWASGEYISKVNDSNNSGNDSSTGTVISGKGIVTASTLNVRSGAGTNYSVVTKAYKNDKVDLLETKSGWYKVKLSNGKTGWASGEYISKVNDSNNSGNDSSTGTVISGKGIVTASTLNVRSGAGTSYSVVAKIYKNDKVDLLEKLNGWYKVKLSNGKTGWVSDDYISRVNDSNDTENNETSTNKAQAVVNLAKKQLGKPYVWGAEGPNSFDCSGLVYYVYKNAANMKLPRTSKEQSNYGTTVSMSNLQPGDLIFSSTDGSGNVNHVGIYIGNNEMIHSPKPGDVVKQTKINTSYWQNTYKWSKRVL